jgi:hypothetical protein
MNHELESAIEEFVFRMNLLSEEERVEAFTKLKEIFCEHCGWKHEGDVQKCQCWNDE